MNVVHAVITIVISFAAGFAASWLIGFKETEDENAGTSADEMKGDEPAEGNTEDKTEGLGIQETTAHSQRHELTVSRQYLHPFVLQ